MANSDRHLKPLGILTLGFAAVFTSGFSQGGPPAVEPTPLLFRAVAVGNTVPLAGIFYEYKGKSLMVYPSDVSLTPAYERPNAGPLKMYREIAPIPPEKIPRRVPVFTANLGSDPLYLIVMVATADNTVTHMIINDSWAAFPVQTVRVLNFSRRNVVVQVEGALAELASKEMHLFPYSKNRLRIRCKVASKEADGWKLQFENSQAVIPGSRVNIVISDCEATVDDPNPDGINVLKMIDPLLPPQPEK